MKIVLVMAMLWHGQLSYSETGHYATMAACQQDFSRLLDKYVADGRRLEDMNGNCYWKPESAK